MLKIEIGISTNEYELPEHYGYYDSIEDAKDALDTIKKEYEREDEE